MGEIMLTMNRWLQVVLVFFSATAFAQDSRQDLGINGCTIRDAATYQSNNLTLVACEGPRGVYYSSDFGGNWISAEGGAYTSGQAYGVAATSFGAYALVSSSSLIRSDIGTFGVFNPNWANVDLALSDNERLVTLVGLESVGRFLIVGTRSGSLIPAVRVLDTESGQIGAAASLPLAGELLHVAVIGNYIFAVRRDNADLDGPNSLYRATFDSGTGAIGSWSDITLNITALLSGDFSSAFVDGVYGGADQAVYVRVSTTGAEKKIYRSVDSGDNFSFSFPNNIYDGNIQGYKYYAPGSFTRSCSLGSTTIINNFISKDGGTTWSRLKTFMSEGFNLFDEDLCIFDPSDNTGNTALVKGVEGFSKTTDLHSNSPTWVSANKGLQGIIVRAISRVKEAERDTVAAVTNAGLAITKSFSRASRKWLFPTCTGRKTCWKDAIALDPTNSNIVFAGTEDIERGIISEDPQGNLSLAWDVILDNPSGATDQDDLPVDLRFRDFAQIPGRIFGLYRWTTSGPSQPTGGIYSFTYSSDPNDTSVTSHPVILGNKPIADLIALNGSTMYAAVNYEGAESTPPGAKAVYRLTIQQDGSVVEDVDSSGELGSSPGIKIFAYDESRDILYAAASNSSFYILEKASSASGAWRKGTSFGPADAVTVDPSSGTIFASRNREIYRSLDQGTTWELSFTGFTDEEFYTLLVTSDDIPEASQSRIAEAQMRAVAGKLVGGSSTGLAKLGVISATPTPKTIASTCKLSVEKKCKGRIRGAPKCLFTASLRRTVPKSPLTNQVLELQRKHKSSWNRVKTMRTGSNGTAKVRIKVRSKSSYRAIISTSTVRCTTRTVNIK